MVGFSESGVQGLVQSPETPEYTRNTTKLREQHQIPHSGMAPETMKKNENDPNMANFVIFWGPNPGVGDLYFFRNLFRISGCQGLLDSVPGPQARNAISNIMAISGCSFFAYSWKLPAYSGAFLLTVDNFSFFTYNWSFSAYSFSSFACSWSFFVYSGKVRLIRALRDCKQRSLTVSKKAPTVSKRSFPQWKLRQID